MFRHRTFISHLRKKRDDFLRFEFSTTPGALGLHDALGQTSFHPRDGHLLITANSEQLEHLLKTVPKEWNVLRPQDETELERIIELYLDDVMQSRHHKETILIIPIDTISGLYLQDIGRMMGITFFFIQQGFSNLSHKYEKICSHHITFTHNAQASTLEKLENWHVAHPLRYEIITGSLHASRGRTLSGLFGNYHAPVSNFKQRRLTTRGQYKGGDPENKGKGEENVENPNQKESDL